MSFIPSLDLSRMLYEEQIAPLLAERFPGVKYAAATLGMCSEVLGLDDEISMDHEWGPRVWLYLAERDHEHYAQPMQEMLHETLPARFKGLDMMWRQPGVDLHDTRETALYTVGVGTVDGALRFCGGLNALPMLDMDWLKISEQHLLEFTSGVVYRDDVGELTRARKMLAHYPDNVLKFLLMCQWNALNGEWWPLGRIGSRGDALGLRMQAAGASQHLMRLAFMVSRQYFPYKKWFGTVFNRLPIADKLGPVLEDMLLETDWRQVEVQLAEAASIVLRLQNTLGLTPPIVITDKRAEDGRHHLDLNFGSIGHVLRKRVQPPLKMLVENQVFWLHERSLILWNQEVGKWAFLLQR